METWEVEDSINRTYIFQAEGMYFENEYFVFFMLHPSGMSRPFRWFKSPISITRTLSDET